MQTLSATVLANFAVGYLWVGSAIAHNYIITNDLLNNTILPNLELGCEYWENELQFEGLGIAQSLIFLLQNKFPDSLESLDELKKHRILFVGGFGGNALGGWVAAVILAAFGIRCDLYVIRDESTSKSTVHPFSKALLNDIETSKPSNITFVHSGSFNQDLDEEFPELKPIIKQIIDPTNNLTKQQTVDALLEEERDEEKNTKYWSFKNVKIWRYSLVLEGVTGAFQDDNNFKLGNVFALMMLNTVEWQHDSFLVSTDFPSFWKDGKPKLPENYNLFKLDALTPSAIIHIAAMKPYVLSDDSYMEKMLHYVVVPRPLEDALADSWSEAFKTLFGEQVASGDIKEISSSTSKGTGAYLIFSYNNVVVDIKQKTLEQCRLTSLTSPVAAVSKYKDNLTAVSGFVITVAA